VEAGKVPGRVEVEARIVGKGKVVHIIIIQYIPTFVRSLELEKMKSSAHEKKKDTVFTFMCTFIHSHSHTCIDNSIHTCTVYTRLCTTVVHIDIHDSCPPSTKHTTHNTQHTTTHRVQIQKKKNKYINYVCDLPGYVKSKYSSAKNKHTFPSTSTLLANLKTNTKFIVFFDMVQHSRKQQ
jgi:hypothetical protein